MDLRLNGQTAVVTGASRGIGLAITRALADEGVHVTAGALKSSAELDELAGTGLVRARQATRLQSHDSSAAAASPEQ